MSGLHLPPAEPPSPAVQDLLEHLQAVRQEIADAKNTRALILAGLTQPDPDGAPWASYRAGLRVGTELKLATLRIGAWEEELQTAEEAARRLGLVL